MYVKIDVVIILSTLPGFDNLPVSRKVVPVLLDPALATDFNRNLYLRCFATWCTCSGQLRAPITGSVLSNIKDLL